MRTCEHCGALDVSWFTPAQRSERAAVLLCLACRRLTIVPFRRVPGGAAQSTEHAA